MKGPAISKMKPRPKTVQTLNAAASKNDYAKSKECASHLTSGNLQ